ESQVQVPSDLGHKTLGRMVNLGPKCSSLYNLKPPLHLLWFAHLQLLTPLTSTMAELVMHMLNYKSMANDSAEDPLASLPQAP
ncbi:hypothetical protein ACQP3C_28055, partial [Escherichia coli]